MTLTSEHRESLEQLQAELNAQKERHGGRMLLRKAPASSPVAPFPLNITVTVPQPDDAASYDCDSLEIRVVLDEAFIDAREDTSGIRIQVDDEALPRRLRERIAAELLQAWRATAPGSGTRFGLGSIFEAASRKFVALVTAVPELVEAYEGADAAGATMRRFAILNEDQQVSVDATVHAPMPAPAARNSEHHSSAAAQQLVAKPGPPAAAAELTWLQRRYGSAFQLLQFAERQGPGGDAAQPGEQPSQPQQPAAEFTVALTPTDPAWDRGRLQLHVHLGASYPAVGSVTITAAESCSANADAAGAPASSGGGGGGGRPDEGLSDGAANMLAKLLTAQAAADACKPAPLRALVRSVDNAAALHVQQAEDLFMEVLRRRKAAAASGTGSSSHSGGGSSKASSLREAAPDAAGAPATEPVRADGSGAAAAPDVHPAALQPALSARRSFGQGLWWPGERLHSDTAAEEADPSSKRAPGGGACSLSRTHSGASGNGGTGSSYSGSGSSDWDGGSSGSDSGRSDDSGAEGHASGGEGAGGARTAVALELLDLAVDNVDVIEPHQLKLHVECRRCRRPGEVVLPAGEGVGRSRRISVAGSCAHCHHDWEVGVRGALVHEHSVVLARLWPVGCVLRDLLPSLLAAQCSACSAVAALRQVQVGRPAARNCSQCHRAMKLQFAAVAFTSASAGGGRGSGKTAALPGRARRSQAGGFASGHPSANGAPEPGQPLPNLGTCAHYRHSHRWLRFPCCGQRFPCDLCHEEGTDGHEMKWATRMVCGFCALEQPIGERCAACGKRLASSANKSLSGRATRHWEGGQGCRDPKRLDRRDARKYRGSKAKTASKKGERVGVAGAGKQRGQWRAAA